MGRHAYLIMCHNNFSILRKLVCLLDDPLNDIYIHVDRKVGKITELKKLLTVNQATITFTERVSVSWGGFSQIRAELTLLKQAAKTPHDYYHLLSGVDLPLKDQTHIHNFFNSHQGKEFIDVDPITDTNDNSSKIRYYYFFQDLIGRKKGIGATLFRRAEACSLKVQRTLGIDRCRKNSRLIRKGSQWFSITHGFATYLLQNERAIVKAYRWGLGVDELLVQTFSLNSPFADNLAKNAMRYIDWKRGSPYTFRSEDFQSLISSEKLFARKFDENTDMEIVDRLYRHITAQDK